MTTQRRVLVVDDEKLVCESCTSVLTEEGYTVETTMSARDGLRRLEREQFDLLLVDLRMPDVDGIELMASIKDRMLTIPIVVITGYPSVETAVESTRLGALEYVPKPFTPDELMSSINKALVKWDNVQAIQVAPEGRQVTAEGVNRAIKEVRTGVPVRPSAARAGMIKVDLNACMACMACVVECGAAHRAAEGLAPDSRIDRAAVARMMEHARVSIEGVGTHCVPLRCNHCIDAPCVKVCPTGALAKHGAEGPVLIDDRLCIGCKNCMLACPFGSIYINGETNMVVKCDLCAGITGPGEDPVCVRTCPASALEFVPVAQAGDAARRKAARDIVDAASSRSGSNSKENRL